jgi:hypothetical protein
VLTLCERPARLGLTNTDPVIDFWVQQTGGEEFQLVPQGEPDNSLPTNLGETQIRTITAVDRAASSVWNSNWARMLPVINVARSSITNATMKSVSRFVREPLSLAVIERQFGNSVHRSCSKTERPLPVHSLADKYRRHLRPTDFTNLEHR